MTGTSLAAPRVLVVEDEYLIRMLLEDMLDELGYGVAAAVGTISEARKIAADGRCHAIAKLVQHVLKRRARSNTHPRPREHVVPLARCLSLLSPAHQLRMRHRVPA